MPARTISGSVWVQWDGVNWTSETDNLISATGRATLETAESGWVGVGSAPPATATIRLANPSGRYSPDNTNSPISGSILGGRFRNKKVKIEVEVDGDSGCTLLTQYLSDIREEAAGNEVELICANRAEKLTALKTSTSLMQDLTTGCAVAEILMEAGATGSSLDNGYTRVPWIWTDAESVWQQLGLLAEAEAGRIYVDRFDTVTFKDASFPYLTSGSIGQIDGDVFGDLSPQYDWSMLGNRVIVAYQPLEQGPKSIIYSHDQTVYVASGESASILARLDYPAISIDTPAANADWYARTAGGIDLSGSTSVTISSCAQRSLVTITNNSVQPVFISGLQLIGLPVIGPQEGEITKSSACSITQYGESSLELQSNPFIQDSVNAGRLANIMMNRLESPKRIYHAQGIPGSPNAMPGEMVKLTESTRLSVSSSPAMIIETSWELGGPGFTMDLRLIDIEGLLPRSDYAVLDTSAWGGSSMFF